MEIFGRSFLPGQKAYFSVDGPRYANQAISQIPVIVLRGGQDGPTLWVNGAVHGHEVSGSQGMWELANELDPQSLKGTIIMTPIANVSAFCERRMKSMVDDFADLDTQFPGSTTGLFAAYQVRMIPHYVLISPEGKIQTAWSGYSEGLLKKIQEQLKKE